MWFTAMGNPRGSLSTRSFRLLSQLSNPSQVSSSAGRSAAASSSSSLETSGAPGTAAAAGTPTRRPQAGSRTWSRSRRDQPTTPAFGRASASRKKAGCRCDTSRALLQRDDARIAACHQRRAEVVCARLLLSPPRLLLVQLDTLRGTENAINASPRSRERQDLYFTQLVCLLVSYRPLARYQASRL